MRKIHIAKLVALLATAVAPGAAHAGDMVPGHTYFLHEASVAEEDFDAVPRDYDGAIVKRVEQGPEFTALWIVGPGRDTTDITKASFARGERRMGLFVPFGEPGKTATESEGWTSFNRPVDYAHFDVDLQRGDDDRTIEGGQARHYTLSVNILSSVGDDPHPSRHRLESELWLLPSLPYSPAPFAVSSAYSDPRLDAALAEKLGPLGMLARVESTYSQQTVDADEAPLGTAHHGTHVTWITELEKTPVAKVDMPIVAAATFDALREDARVQPRKDCKVVMTDGTPDFVVEHLAEAAREPFLKALAKRCARRFPELKPADQEEGKHNP